VGLYEKYILPKMTDLVCSVKPVTYQRNKVVPLAKGRVLEIGIGSGLNFPHYDSSNVDYVWGLDPSPQMRKMAERRMNDLPFDVEFIGLSGEEIPLETSSVNTVLVTYTLCTILDVVQALREMSRVLTPSGELIFCEHGLAPDEGVRKWQNIVNPIWKRMGGGCNLNRPIPDLIEQGGFKITNIETMYIPGWKPVSFNYWGVAVQR
jgi:ubiquinone/menaquinone biosynthesis C-methylase UbiE